MATITDSLSSSVGGENHLLVCDTGIPEGIHSMHAVWYADDVVYGIGNADWI